MRSAPVELWPRDVDGYEVLDANARLSEVSEELDRAVQWSDVSVVSGYVDGADCSSTSTPLSDIETGSQLGQAIASPCRGS